MNDADLGAHPQTTTRLYGTAYATGDKIVGVCYTRCAGALPATRAGVIGAIGSAVEGGTPAPCRIGAIKEGDRLPAGVRIGVFKCKTCHRPSPAMFSPDADWVAARKEE